MEVKAFGPLGKILAILLGIRSNPTSISAVEISTVDDGDRYGRRRSIRLGFYLVISAQMPGFFSADVGDNTVLLVGHVLFGYSVGLLKENHISTIFMSGDG